MSLGSDWDGLDRLRGSRPATVPVAQTEQPAESAAGQPRRPGQGVLPPPRTRPDPCDTFTELCSATRSLNTDIRSIGLDISPQLTPAAAAEVTGQESTRTLPSERREWRDRDGNEIAYGRILGFAGGRVQLESNAGGAIEVSPRDLSDADRCYFADAWGIPPECLLTEERYANRHFAPLTYTWKASNLCHNPLYFEETQLERYGHTAGPLVQPAVSGAHFFLSTISLPYKMSLHPLGECRYPLGTYRPGDCAPWLLPAVPISLKAAVTQAAAVNGAITILP